MDEFIRRFVYIYQIAIFFWCAGYVWKRKSLSGFAKSIIKNQYLKTVGFCAFSLLLYPFFKFLNVISFESPELLRRLYNTLVYKPAGILTGALWFMPFFTLAIVLYYLIDYFIPEAKSAIAICGGIAGCYLVQNGYLSCYYFNYSLTMLPIVYFGELCKQKQLLKYIKKWMLPASVILISLLNVATKLQIELSHNLVYGIAGFYPMIFLGILFVVSLSSSVNKYTEISNKIAFLGKNSFWIMGMHFWGFKIYDGIVALVRNDINPLLFPISCSEEWNRIVYCILGLALPVTLLKIYHTLSVVYMNQKNKINGYMQGGI